MEEGEGEEQEMGEERNAAQESDMSAASDDATEVARMRREVRKVGALYDRESQRGWVASDGV